MMPVAGAHYPRTTGEFLAWFRTDEDCLDYLEWLRWPDGFICPGCGHAGGWRLGDGPQKWLRSVIFCVDTRESIDDVAVGGIRP